MYTEIPKVNKLTIAQHDSDAQLLFGAIKFLKFQINQKNATAYTEDAFIWDIFLQLKQDSLPVKFWLEFSCKETWWMMNKAKITSELLIDDASAYFVSLKNTGAWKTEILRNTQIIELTTKITELENKVTNLLTVKAPTRESVVPNGGTGTGSIKYVFVMWHLDKFDNKSEHDMIEQDDIT
jgi:hypothetical protein